MAGALARLSQPCPKVEIMTSSPSVRHGLRAVSLFLPFVFLASCTTPLPGGGQPGPGGADDDDSWAADDDDDADGPVEENCDDGLDEDEDSLTDCEDPDCADVFHCTWPGLGVPGCSSSEPDQQALLWPPA